MRFSFRLKDRKPAVRSFSGLSVFTTIAPGTGRGRAARDARRSFSLRLRLFTLDLPGVSWNCSETCACHAGGQLARRIRNGSVARLFREVELHETCCGSKDLIDLARRAVRQQTHSDGETLREQALRRNAANPTFCPKTRPALFVKQLQLTFGWPRFFASWPATRKPDSMTRFRCSRRGKPSAAQ